MSEAATPIDPYERALLDWLACACRGGAERATRAARGLGDGLFERVATAATAGHILDFDDTYRRGLAHLSAPTAPVAIVVGAERNRSVGEVIDAYAAGFEAMGAFAAASAPALYERGWHPTAVCGVLGAAVTAARLLELDSQTEDDAVALALLRAGGLLAAFGSDGKALQVGLAASAGAIAAHLAAAGASAPLDRISRATAGFEGAFEAAFDRVPEEAAISGNWLKPWPSCLQTMSAIEAADRARNEGLDRPKSIIVTVPPFARQAAAYDDVESGLEAKFSIPYLTALTLLHGPPDVESFAGVDPRARALAAECVAVRTDTAFGESEAVLWVDGQEVSRIPSSLGSPERPMSEELFVSKLRSLAGEELRGALADREAAARSLLRFAGLS